MLQANMHIVTSLCHSLVLVYLYASFIKAEKLQVKTPCNGEDVSEDRQGQKRTAASDIIFFIAKYITEK